MTYERIGPAIKDGSEFLITLENWSNPRRVNSLRNQITSPTPQPTSPQYRLSPYRQAATAKVSDFALISDWALSKPVSVYPNLDISKSYMAFCVPPDDDLMQYWDRVEDRLFKIRNCMNISGVRRQLALFQPPIDPMMLIRAKAAGLSLDDILKQLDAPLPPYRCNYLIEKAKQFTQTVQSFGAALLTALANKDVEELTLLRAVHEQAILLMTKEAKASQVEEAQRQLQALEETKTNIQTNRIDYYQGLIEITSLKRMGNDGAGK